MLMIWRYLLDPIGLYLMSREDSQILFFPSITIAAATLVLLAFRRRRSAGAGQGLSAPKIRADEESAASRIGLLLLLVMAIGAFFVFDLGAWLTLASLKARQSELAGVRRGPAARSPIGAFFLLYVAVTALSLPGAAIMTLAAGAIFGLVRRHAHRLLRLGDRREPRLPLLALSAARLGQGEVREPGRRDRPRHRPRRRLLSADAAADPRFPLLPDQPGDGADRRCGSSPSTLVSQIGMLLGTIVYRQRRHPARRRSRARATSSRPR